MNENDSAKQEIFPCGKIFEPAALIIWAEKNKKNQQNFIIQWREL